MDEEEGYVIYEICIVIYNIKIKDWIITLFTWFLKNKTIRSSITHTRVSKMLSIIAIFLFT